jgi:hypothetical protein
MRHVYNVKSTLPDVRWKPCERAVNIVRNEILDDIPMVKVPHRTGRERFFWMLKRLTLQVRRYRVLTMAYALARRAGK